MSDTVRQEIDGLRTIAQDLQKRVQLLEGAFGQPAFFTREQAEAMLEHPGPVAARIVGDDWAGYDETQRDQTTALVRSIGRLLVDAPAGSKVGLHVAGGKAHLWVREEAAP